MRLTPAWRVSVAAGVATAVVAAAVTFTGTSSAAILFSDDFADGNATGWTTSGGSWSVTSQAYRQSSTSSDTRAQAGQSSWTNYSVQARVQATAFNGSNRFVAVLGRAQSMTSYYFLALRSSNVVELKKLVGGSSTTLANVPFPCFSASGYADSGPGRLVQRNNTFAASGACEVAGSVVEPSGYYSYTLTTQPQSRRRYPREWA